MPKQQLQQKQEEMEEKQEVFVAGAGCGGGGRRGAEQDHQLLPPGLSGAWLTARMMTAPAAAAEGLPADMYREH
jgi:hypothetical protein